MWIYWFLIKHKALYLVLLLVIPTELSLFCPSSTWYWELDVGGCVWCHTWRSQIEVICISLCQDNYLANIHVFKESCHWQLSLWTWPNAGSTSPSRKQSTWTNQLLILWRENVCCIEIYFKIWWTLILKVRFIYFNKTLTLTMRKMFYSTCHIEPYWRY